MGGVEWGGDPDIPTRKGPGNINKREYKPSQEQAAGICGEPEVLTLHMHILSMKMSQFYKSVAEEKAEKTW